MRIRSILTTPTPTFTDLLTAVFAAATAQAHGGTWVITTAVSPAATTRHLQILEWLGLFWDEGIEQETPADPAYTLTELTPTTVLQSDKTHEITHEIISGLASPYNPSLHTIKLPPLIATNLTIATLLDDDYLPTAVWHYLLTLGWPKAAQQAHLNSYQVKQSFRLEELETTAQIIDRHKLEKLNRQYIQQLPPDLLASKIKPYLEEWFSPIPTDGRWLHQLAATIRPHLSHIPTAPDLAAWAFPDGWEITPTAEPVVTDPAHRPILISLIAELTHIVLLDPKTADSILAGLQTRYPHTPIHPIITAALTGHTTPFHLPSAMSLIGKAEALHRLGQIR